MMGVLPKSGDIIELLKKGSLSEAQQKVVELREGALELQEENIGLRERIKELEGILDVRESLEWNQPYYWLRRGQRREGPFCQQCYDSTGKLIRLQGDGKGWWECKTCKNNFTDKSFDPNRYTRADSDFDP
jgi:hypothetical protein